ncbi:MAG: hypothetical protein HC883_02680 [Bdellovibrionaceae bacterium]|nr:hypothetical protein [Pseudobdellovibrionaceae bacterium]
MISQTKDTPSISFLEFKNQITFGDRLEFKITIEDPSAVSGKAAEIRSVHFVTSAQANGALQAALLDASKGVTSCDDPGRALDETHFEFICTFDSNLIKGVRKHLNSGKSVNAGFYVTALSTATGKMSAATLQKFEVMFEKVQGAKR